MKRTARSKRETHARIVGEGACAMRRCGFDGISIADTMKLAGLTHGGFYSHFASRDVLLAELVDRAGTDAMATFSSVMAAAPAGQARQALLRTYLSLEHVQNPQLGCPVSALVTEMSRQSPTVRRASTRRIKELIDMVARQAADAGQPAAQDHALVTTATMVGAVVLARAVDEEPLSEAVLQAARAHLDAATD